MAKAKHVAPRRGGKKVKPAPRASQARPAKKAGRPVRKPAVKAARKPATKVTGAARAKKHAGAAVKAGKKQVRTPAKSTNKKAPGRKAVSKKTAGIPISNKKTSKIPTVKKATPPKSTRKSPAPRKSATKGHDHATAGHSGHVASHPAHQPPRKQHARPTGGVAARLNVAAVAEQTVTREDGRYALPATVNIELPKGYHPSLKEEYMNPKQLAYFRQKLKDWRDQLVEESRQTMENLREEVRDVGDDAERATRETENSLELRTRDRYRKLISKIEKALRKIEEGRYGFCEETDEEIGLERLEARPIATLSLDAQERREHLQKQMGD
ncbi:MAG: RNA polymerase-binding protein DksA [Rhodanobacteraceae bacterium]